MSLYPCCECIVLLLIISKAVKSHCIHAVRVSSFSTSFQRLLNVTVSMLWGYRLLHIISKAVKCHCIHAVRVSSFSTSFPRLSNVTVSMLWGYRPSPHHFQGCQMSLYPSCEGIFLLHIISKLLNVTVSMLWGYRPSPHHFQGCQMSLYPCCEGIFLLHIISKAVKCHCIHAVRYLPSPHHFQGCQMSLYPCCEGIFLLHIISKAVKCHCIHAVRVSSFSTSFQRLSNVTVSMLWEYLPSPHHFQRLSNVTVSMLWEYLPSPHHFQGCQMSLYPCCEGIFLLHIISKAVKCHCIHAVRVSSFSTSFQRLSNVTVSMLWEYLPSPHHFQGCQMPLYPCCEGIFLLHIISKAVKCHCIHAVRVSSFSTSFPRLSNVTVSMLWGYLPSPHHFQGC